MPALKQILLEELSKFGSVENINEQAKSLVKQQRSVWGVAEKNFNALNKVHTKTFDFEHFKIITQFNPERIRSSAAKTDSKSIAERPCFLCLKNLPPQQKGIIFQNSYLILVNPFPIFPIHLTISSLHHTPQLIKNYFEDLLDISKALPDFTVFYNGPKCGASAPDHFHFQAGNKGLLPIETELTNLKRKYSEVLFKNETTTVFSVENYLRRFIVNESGNKEAICGQFEKIYNCLDNDEHEEPMMNILCNYENGKWQVIIFPRNKQRPSHYFRKDNKQITASPASVELGGVLVLPKEDDFKKTTKKEIAEIFDEVTIDNESFQELKRKLKQ